MIRCENYIPPPLSFSFTSFPAFSWSWGFFGEKKDIFLSIVNVHSKITFLVSKFEIILLDNAGYITRIVEILSNDLCATYRLK